MAFGDRNPTKIREWQQRSRKPLARSKRSIPSESARLKRCKRCGEEFYDAQARGIGQSYCSMRCFGDAQSERVRATYPLREEVVRLYVDQGMSDRDLGAHYGHSYQWSLTVRRHYGIPGNPPRRKPLKQRTVRAQFNISLKNEEACRNCGIEGTVLHLHHAVPRSLSPAGRCDLRNGIPLCPTCHHGWHAGTVRITREVFTAEEWAFIQTLIGPSWLDKRYPEPTDEPFVPTCRNGHPYTPENTGRNPNGSRRCRTCGRESMRRRRAKKRAEANGDGA